MNILKNSSDFSYFTINFIDIDINKINLSAFDRKMEIKKYNSKNSNDSVKNRII